MQSPYLRGFLLAQDVLKCRIYKRYTCINKIACRKYMAICKVSQPNFAGEGDINNGRK